MIYRKHIQREYLAAQRRDEGEMETVIPQPLNDLLNGLALLTVFGIVIFFVAMGWSR